MPYQPQGRDRFYIDGAWVEPSGSETLEVVDPATEAVLGTIPMGDATDVDRAVAAARAAFPGWAATPAEERAKYLTRLTEALTARAGDAAATITAEMGAPTKIAQAVQVGLPLSVLGSYAKLLPDYAFTETVGNSQVVREPVGVVAAITPWNYPLHQVIAKVAAALAAGCTVVLKPSEVAPLSAYLLADIVDEVGLPGGVFNLVCGTGPVVGEALAAHPDVDMVSFTGSTRAGRRVSEVAARTIKRVALELGGKSANVILAGRRPGQGGQGRGGELLPQLRADLHGVDPDARRPGPVRRGGRARSANRRRFHRRGPDRRGHPARPAGQRRPARAGARLHHRCGRRGGPGRRGRRGGTGGADHRLLRPADRASPT